MQQLRHIDHTILVVLATFLSSILTLFLYCYYGKIATKSFEDMADDLYQANWHDLPIGLQKYFIIMIANSQRPIYYHGFGVVILNLETFTKVSKCRKIFGS